jgi:hypothetical protein
MQCTAQDLTNVYYSGKKCVHTWSHRQNFMPDILKLQGCDIQMMKNPGNTSTPMTHFRSEIWTRIKSRAFNFTSNCQKSWMQVFPRKVTSLEKNLKVQFLYYCVNEKIPIVIMDDYAVIDRYAQFQTDYPDLRKFELVLSWYKK